MIAIRRHGRAQAGLLFSAATALDRMRAER
jgi:hypothetical protein